MKIQPLDFEKPIAELEKKLDDLRRHSRAQDMNFDAEVRRMQAKIEETKRAKQSAMPDGLLNTLTLEEVADLFAYLTKTPAGDVANPSQPKARSAKAKSQPKQ